MGRYLENGDFNVISCGSTGISPSQSKYSVFVLELTGISWATKKCYHYIAHNAHKVVYYTDHAELAHLENCALDTIRNPRVLRLMEDLLCHDFEVQYIKSSVDQVADYLSRLISKSADAPDYPRLLHSYRPIGCIRILDDSEQYDFDLLPMAVKGAGDTEYSKGN